MTPHFNLAEFVRSAEAARRRIDNQLPPDLMPAAQATLEMMERIRSHLSGLAGREVPIQITSGYRSPALNLAIGSSSTSDHPKAMAVDFVCPAFGTPLEVCRAIAPAVSVLGVGQLIHEFGEWIHVSTRVPTNPVNRLISIGRGGTLPGIVAV